MNAAPSISDACASAVAIARGGSPPTATRSSHRRPRTTGSFWHAKTCACTSCVRAASAPPDHAPAFISSASRARHSAIAQSAEVWRAASLTSAASGSIERWHAAMAASSFIACTAGTARDAGGAPSSGLAGSRA